MAMLNLEPLLALQECDLNRKSLEESLAAVPREVAAVEARIAAERQAIDQAKSEWRELETRKKSLEGEIKGAEEQVARYKSQQLQVRKNDEYQALTHEIESNTARIGTLEEEEIRVIFWKQLSILGSTMGTDGEFRALLEAVGRRLVRPVVDTVFPLEEVARAYERIESGEGFGKVVVRVAG